jgi:hypothetical protein
MADTPKIMSFPLSVLRSHGTEMADTTKITSFPRKRESKWLWADENGFPLSRE